MTYLPVPNFVLPSSSRPRLSSLIIFVCFSKDGCRFHSIRTCVALLRRGTSHHVVRRRTTRGAKSSCRVDNSFHEDPSATAFEVLSTYYQMFPNGHIPPIQLAFFAERSCFNDFPILLSRPSLRTVEEFGRRDFFSLPFSVISSTLSLHKPGSVPQALYHRSRALDSIFPELGAIENK